MDTFHPDTPTAQAQSAAYRHLFLALRAAIPPVDDTPLAAERRDQAVIAQVAGLCPANMAEATLAAQYVAANAQALHCLALTRQHPTPGKDADHLAARANTMMRRAEGALGNLIRLQTMRGKRDADPTAASHAAWTEHAVAAWMAGNGESQNPRHNPDLRSHEISVILPGPHPLSPHPPRPRSIVVAPQPHAPPCHGSRVGGDHPIGTIKPPVTANTCTSRWQRPEPRLLVSDPRWHPTPIVGPSVGIDGQCRSPLAPGK